MNWSISPLGQTKSHISVAIPFRATSRDYLSLFIASYCFSIARSFLFGIPSLPPLAMMLPNGSSCKNPCPRRRYTRQTSHIPSESRGMPFVVPQVHRMAQRASALGKSFLSCSSDLQPNIMFLLWVFLLRWSLSFLWSSKFHI